MKSKDKKEVFDVDSSDTFLKLKCCLLLTTRLFVASPNVTPANSTGLAIVTYSSLSCFNSNKLPVLFVVFKTLQKCYIYR